MSSSYITLSYHISCSFLLSLLLIWSPFYSILFYSTLFQIDSIHCIVQYSISYQWMICVYLSVCPSVCSSVCLSVCLSVWISLCFLFFTLFSFLFLFSFLMNVFLTHTHGHGHTNTYEYMFLLMTRTYYFKSM